MDVETRPSCVDGPDQDSTGGCQSQGNADARESVLLPIGANPERRLRTLGALSPGAAAAAVPTAHDEGEKPDASQDGGDDEEPMRGETRAEDDDHEQCN